jgi:hypothetical protein
VAEIKLLMHFVKQFLVIPLVLRNGRNRWQLEMMPDYLARRAQCGKCMAASQRWSAEFARCLCKPRTLLH